MRISINDFTILQLPDMDLSGPNGYVFLGIVIVILVGCVIAIYKDDKNGE